MLWNYSSTICWGVVWLSLLLTVCAAIAYGVNSRRPPDDPKKRQYPFMAVLLTPITAPFTFLLLTLALFVFIVRALLFALFLFVFIPSIILLRKLEEPTLIEKILAQIGEPLLKINTYLIKLAFSLWPSKPRLA